MPFHDYTARKNSNLSRNSKNYGSDLEDSFQTDKLSLQSFQEPKKEPVNVKYVNPQPTKTQNNSIQVLPQINQKNFQPRQSLPNQTNNQQFPNQVVQYRFLNPPVQLQPQPVPLILAPPPLQQQQQPQVQQQQLQPPQQQQPQKKQVETRSIFVGTDDVETANKGTQIERDLVKIVSKGVNTDLRADQLQLKHVKPQVNYFNEGFRTYYDDHADVLGVMCFLCWANCCSKCNNICKGCRNTISCPVYCWICFIIPAFLILIGGIVVCVLIYLKVIST